MKICLDKVMMNLVILLPITTLFQGMIPFINKAVLGILLLMLLYFSLINRHSVKETVYLFLTVLVSASSFLYTNGMAETVNLYFYFPLFVLFSSYVIRRFDRIKKYMEENTGYIRNVVMFWDTCVIISMFFHSSYKDIYFWSFTGNIFRTAMAAMAILSYITVLVLKKKRDILLSIVPLFCILSGGSRTYLAIGLAVCSILYFLTITNKKHFLLGLLPIGLAGAYIVLQSNIMERIIDSMTVTNKDFYQDFWIKFTSGRSMFWEADMKAFFSGNVLNQLLGYGHNFVYDVNEMSIGARIWGHNDFVNILLSYGYIGLIAYLGMFILMFRFCSTQFHYPMWMKCVLIFIWLFNAFFNMFYTYICAVASYPFLLFSTGIFLEKLPQKMFNE